MSEQEIKCPECGSTDMRPDRSSSSLDENDVLTLISQEYQCNNYPCCGVLVIRYDGKAKRYIGDDPSKS